MRSILLIITVTLFVSCSTNPNIEINDFVFKSRNSLTKLYGTPTEELIKDLDNYALIWNLENDMKVTVFYASDKFENPEVIRVNNLDVDPDLFYADFGWETPIFKGNDNQMTISGLKGVKKALYKKGTKILNIELDNPKIETFGQKSHDQNSVF